MDARWVRADDTLSRRLEDCVLVLARSITTPVALEGSGALLWDLLEVPIELDELAGVLAEVHGADPEQVRADIAPMLEELVALGIARRIGG